MEARSCRVIAQVTSVLLLSLLSAPAFAEQGGYRTKNFVVSAPTPALAKEIGDMAEKWRHDLAIEWLGSEMPPWSTPCPIHAKVAPNLGAGGATSFVFDRGEVFNWKMNIQGSRERVLDSVLPHEVTHTIFASYFRSPLPRWADEGACTTMEHSSEIAKQERMLIDFLKTGRGIPFGEMFAMKEYPQDVMPLYSQGHSLSEWLIEDKGRAEFLRFLADGMKDDDWRRAVHDHYGFADLYSMQNTWLDWVKAGRPQLAPGTDLATQIASNTTTGRPGSPSPVMGIPASYRGQSPDVIPANIPSNANVVNVAAPTTYASTPTDANVAPAGGSVYAAAMAQAQQSHQTSKLADASVYDASLQTGVIRR
jgi:hypothetical protein